MNPCMTGLSKVFVYEWNDRGLTGIAFVDCDSQVLQLRSFRHYIVCSDVHKSVQVLRFREDVRMIEAIASDYCNGRLVLLFHRWIYLLAASQPLMFRVIDAANFGVNQSALSVVCSDQFSNIFVSTLLSRADPEFVQDISKMPFQLAPRGDFHFGQRVSSIMRVPLLIPSTNPSMANFNISNILATFQGGIAVFSPVPLAIARRLADLQDKLATDLVPVASLNPLSFRLPRSSVPWTRPVHSSVLDGLQLARCALRFFCDFELCSPSANLRPFCSFLHLDYYRQVSLARTFGWTREQILADLIYLEMPAELLVPVF
jgi:hypothetical protein